MPTLDVYCFQCDSDGYSEIWLYTNLKMSHSQICKLVSAQIFLEIGSYNLCLNLCLFMTYVSCECDSSMEELQTIFPCKLVVPDCNTGCPGTVQLPDLSTGL